MEENEIYDFITICRDFVDSSKELRDAANLCDNDPIKQEMVAHIIPEFQQMWARSEGIKTLLEKKDFSLNRFSNRVFAFSSIRICGVLLFFIELLPPYLIDFGISCR